MVALNTSGELEGDKSTGTARLSLELAEHTITASIDTVLDEKEAPLKLAGIIASHGSGYNSPRLDVGEYGGFVDGFTAIFSKASDCQLLLIDGGNNQLVHNVEYEIPRELINITASIAPKK